VFKTTVVKTKKKTKTKNKIKKGVTPLNFYVEVIEQLCSFIIESISLPEVSHPYNEPIMS